MGSAPVISAMFKYLRHSFEIGWGIDFFFFFSPPLEKIELNIT